MADIVSIKKQSDNVREAVFQFNYQYVDTGNESAVGKIDVSTLDKNSNGEDCTGIRILSCNFNVAGMTVQVLKEGDTQDPIMLNLTEDQSGIFDFTDTGGLPSTTELTEATRTYAVTVVNDGGNKFALGGVTAPPINLLKNHTYIFDQSNGSNAGHPIAFKQGAGGASYTTGVTTTGTLGTPFLYYYCTVHGDGMGNGATLINPTGDVAFTTTGAAANDSYQIVMRVKKNYKVQ